MSYEDRIETLCTSEQAVAKIRKAPANSVFYMHVRNDAYIEGKPGMIFQGALSCSVKFTRKEAIQKCTDMLSKNLEERGGRIRISVHTDMRYTAKVGEEKKFSIYWIG